MEATHSLQLHLLTLPRSSSLAVELQRPLWGKGEGRGVLAAACRPVQSPKVPCVHNKRWQGEREKDGGSARAHSEPPYPLGGEAGRPGAEDRREEHGGSNCLPSPAAPEKHRERARTHGVRAPKPSLPRPGRYAEAAGAREGARGLLGPSGRRFPGERSRVRTSSGPRRSDLAAGLLSFVALGS